MQGFSFLELVISLAIGGIVMSGATLLFRQSLEVKKIVLDEAAVQHNLRVGLNHLIQELATAGTGTPRGGVQLPVGTELEPRFGCDAQSCYVSPNSFPERRLFPLTPGDGSGAILSGVETDIVTISFRDFNASLSQFVLSGITPTSAAVSTETLPNLTDGERGVEVGDVVVLCNANGCAAAVVTARTEYSLTFEEGDPLQFNQPSAQAGNIASIANPESEGTEFPPTTAYLIDIVTYYVDPATRRLMRQVSAHPPIPLAEEIYELQLTYDVFDEATSTGTSNLANAGGHPNQIRKVNLVMAASAGLEGSNQHFETLSTSVSTRNLAYRDRYQ